MDAGLAKVMNSSVGSSALKALDTILKTDNTTIANNAVDRLFNNLKNSTKLVGSDDVMFTYLGGWTHDGTGNEFGSAFYSYKTNSFVRFDTAGAVKIKTIQTGSRTDSKHTFYLRAYDGAGNQIKTVQANLANGTTAEIELSLNVVAGGQYKFAIGCYNVASPSTLLDICGKTVMLSPNVALV